MSTHEASLTQSLPAQQPTGRWVDALTRPTIWKRAMIIGLMVGMVQVFVNQGDAWLGSAITPRLVVKSILTLTVAFTVALLSTASGYIAFTTAHARLASQLGIRHEDSR